MKKILSIFLCAAMLTGFVFAQDLTPTADVRATLTWGIDFGSGTDRKVPDWHAVPTHGFYNDLYTDVYIPFLANRQDFIGGSENKDGDVYVDFRFQATPTGQKMRRVSAKLVFFHFYLTTYNKPSFVSDYAWGWQPITVDAGVDDWFTPGFTGWGTKIGYANKDVMNLDVGLKLGSNGSWHQRPADGGKKNTDRRVQDSKYAVGLDFSMEPLEKYLSIKATVNAILGNAKDSADIKEGNGYGYKSGFGEDGIQPKNHGGKDGKAGFINFGLKLDSEPVENLYIGLGFDGATALTYEDKDGKLAETFGWDAGLTAGYKWVDFGLYVCSKATDKHGYNVAGTDPSKWNPNTANLAMHAGFNSEDDGDTNFVPGLAFHAIVNVYDLLCKRNKESIDSDYAKGVMMAYNTARVADPDTAEVPDEVKRAALGTIPLGVNVGVSYKASINDSMWIKPFANFWGETNHCEQHLDVINGDVSKSIAKSYFGIVYNFGVTFQPIEKAEITAKWQQGKLNLDRYEGGWGGEYMIATPVQQKMHNGTFTLALTLIF